MSSHRLSALQKLWEKKGVHHNTTLSHDNILPMWWFQVVLQDAHTVFINSIINSLGCSVGTCWPSRSSFNMCRSVVLPALSRPRKTSFPDFLYRPGGITSQMLWVKNKVILNPLHSLKYLYFYYPGNISERIHHGYTVSTLLSVSHIMD